MKAVAGLALVLGLVVIPAAAQTAPKYEMPPPPGSSWTSVVVVGIVSPTR